MMREVVLEGKVRGREDYVRLVGRRRDR